MNLEIYSFSEVTSTNDYARELLNQHNLVLVSALYQNSGRGRKGNDWFGSYGKNIYLSIGINHKNPQASNHLATIQAMSALIVQKSLNATTRTNNFIIKYPNDIYAKDGEDYKKIAGILIEHNFLGLLCVNSIIGIGINVFEDNFPQYLIHNSTSLKMLNLVDTKNSLLKSENALQTLQNSIIENFNFYYDLFINENASLIFNEWKDELKMIGKDVMILESGKTAKILEILEDCRLRATILENNSEIIIDNGNSIRYKLD